APTEKPGFPPHTPLHPRALASKSPPRVQRRTSRRCGSSVVEHSLGKGEVESSILSHSTISPFGREIPLKYLKGNENFGVSYTPFCPYRRGSAKAKRSTVRRIT